MNDSICLATNYLLMTEATVLMWEGLHRELEACEVQLVLLTTSIPEGPVAFTVIQVPYLLKDYAKQFLSVEDEAVVAPEDFDLLAADSARSAYPYSSVDGLPGLSACRRIIRSVLTLLEPGVVLTWDSTSPLACITTHLCNRMGIPTRVLERGFLPETLMIESRGIQGASDLRTQWLAYEPPREVPGLFSKTSSYFRENRPKKYVKEGAVTNLDDLRNELDLTGQRVVVFFGQFDACGLIPANSRQRYYNSPVFSSTLDAMMALWGEVSKLQNVALVFKPHPMDREPYSVARIDGVRVIENADVHSLIEIADVVAAQFTTLQFEAALYEKPVLLLGQSAWCGRGAAYEVVQREMLPAVLCDALDRVEWARHGECTRSFVSWLMNDFLIGYTSTVPTRRRIADLAKFLATITVRPVVRASVEQRIELTLGWLSQVRVPTSK